MQKQYREYRLITDAEREEISRGLAQGESISAIGNRLRRSVSTVSREVCRNGGTSGYRSFSASRRAKASASSRRAGKRRLSMEDRLRRYVFENLRKRWSPEEIAKRM